MKKIKAVKSKVVMTLPSEKIKAGNEKPENRSKTEDPGMNCNILILDDNHTKVCFLELDISLTELTLHNDIRNKIERATDIKSGNIIIWTTEKFSGQNKTGKISTGIGGVKAYNEGFTKKIVEEVVKADGNYYDVILKTDKTTIGNIQETDCSCDKELITLSLWENDDKLFSLLVSFGCQLSIFGSKHEAQIANKVIWPQIENSIRSSTAIEGRIRTVFDKITLPLSTLQENGKILQGIAIHYFTLITVPAQLNIVDCNKIKEDSPYKHTMILSLTGKKAEPEESKMIASLVKEKILAGLLSQSVKVMERKASDNKYLHKDFHISMNLLMNYLYDNFGEEALINYLKQYSRSYHKPLNEKLKTGDKEALVDYLKDIYEKEEWPVNITSDENSVEIIQDACPGISHILSKGWKPCPCYKETYNTVYKTICENTPFEYILEYFNEETGACKQLFIRKEAKQ